MDLEDQYLCSRYSWMHDTKMIMIIRKSLCCCSINYWQNSIYTKASSQEPDLPNFITLSHHSKLFIPEANQILLFTFYLYADNMIIIWSQFHWQLLPKHWWIGVRGPLFFLYSIFQSNKKKLTLLCDRPFSSLTQENFPFELPTLYNVNLSLPLPIQEAVQYSAWGLSGQI